MLQKSRQPVQATSDADVRLGFGHFGRTQYGYRLLVNMFTRFLPPAGRGRAVLAALACLVPLVATNPASAAPADAKRAEARQVASRLETLGDRLSILDEDYNEARLKVLEIERQVANAEQAKADTAVRFDRAKGVARDRAVEAYMTGGGLSRAARLIDGTGDDVLLRNQYLTTAASQDAAAIDGLNAAREDLERETAALAARKADAEAAERRVRDRRREVERLVREQKALLAKVQGEVAALVRAEERRRAEDATRRARVDLGRPTSPSRRSLGPPPPGTDAPAPSPGAAAAVAFAKQQLGKPYSYGASGPNSYDCSGLTMSAWREGGKSLPHSSRAQYSATARVALADIAPGDLVFYGSPIHHVGIYVGGGQMVDAPHSGSYVRYASIYRRDLVGVGRP
jgi:peptidoglycan DL-endopeptidase CwlO